LFLNYKLRNITQTSKTSNSKKQIFANSLFRVPFSVFRTPHSAFRFQKQGRRGGSPVRLSRRRFLLRFIEKENGGGTTKKALAFFTYQKSKNRTPSE